MANAKAQISGQTTGLTSEDAVLAATGLLSVFDPDPGQSFAASRSNSAAKFGWWSVAADGTWQYLLDNTNASVQALGAGKTLTDSFTVTSLDGSASKAVTITITGTNDTAVISGKTSGSVAEDKTYQTFGTVIVSDRDSGEAHTQAVWNGVAAHGTWSIDGKGNWNYKLNNADPAVQGLAAGETMTDSFAVTSQDGSASQIITITITGANDVPVITGQASGQVTEDSGAVATGTLVINDKDHDQSHSQAAAGSGKYGSWTVDADGHWNYQLDNTNAKVQALGAGKTLTDSFVVTSQDGTAHKTVTVTIVGSNDVATIVGQTSGHVTENTALKATGTVTVSDIDSGEAHSKATSNTAATYGTWSVDSNGHWTYQLDKLNPAVVALPIGQTLTDSFAISSQDGSASQTITIAITGTNHVPTITGHTTGFVSEDNSTTVDGFLNVADPDAGQSHTQVVTDLAASYGTWSVDSNGHWTYQLDNANPAVQALGIGHSLVDSFTVKSLDGSATQLVSITIVGTNDGPVTANSVVSGSEDKTISGQLVATDVDLGDTLTFNLSLTGHPSHGTVTINPDGSYSYTPAADYNGSDSFTYYVTDGHGAVAVATVTLNIAPVNDAPTQPVDSDGSDNAITTGAAAGTLVGITVHATDIDSPTLTYTLTDDAGGRFQIDAQTGVISVANGANLTAGSYSVTAVASDGLAQSSPQEFSITVMNAGPNHAPDLAAFATFAFVAADADGWGVWITEDGGQPVRAATFNNFPQFLTDAGGKLYFSADDGTHGQELWAYDPTTKNLDQITDLWPGSGSSSPEYLTEMGGKLYFSTYNTNWGNELHIYDLASGTVSTAPDIAPGNLGASLQYLTAVDGKLYFAAYEATHGGELWVYDPQTNTTTLAADVFPGWQGSYPKFLTELSGKLYFNASDSSHGSQLWVYDPATHAAHLAGAPSPISYSYPMQLVPLDGKLYYTSTDPASGREIWVYDPLTNKNSLAVDLVPGIDGSSPGDLTVLHGKLYFIAFADGNGSHPSGYELWSYDPSTQAATVMSSLTFNGQTLSPDMLKAVGDKIYFSADDGVHGRELWVYDPATKQTSLYADLYPGASVSITGNAVELDGHLYFSGYDQTHTSELWVYDAATNTAHAAPGLTSASGVAPQFIAAVDGKLYYAAYDATHGTQLWTYDPQTQQANLVGDATSGNLGTDPQYLAAVNGKLYFSSYDATHGYELKVYDPVGHSVSLISDLLPGTDGSNPKFLTAVDGKIYFSATDVDHGEELWVCDTSNQTVSLVQNIAGGADSSSPHSFTVAGGKIYFLASDGQYASEVWLFDPVLQYAKIVAIPSPPLGELTSQTLTAVGDDLAFTMDYSAYGNEVWFYRAATGTFSLASDINHGVGGSNPHCLTALDGKLYFSATQDGSHYSLWVFDPQTNITVSALNAPLGNVQYMTEIDGKLLISVPGNNGAFLLYSYDPSTHTTSPVTTTGGNPNNSNPQDIVTLHNDSITLPTIEENPTTNLGVSVASLLAGHVIDIDPGAKSGIALIGADNSHGQWQYSLDGGAHWLALSNVSDHAATLLDGSARLRFVPEVDWAGHVAVDIRAWDQTDGHHSGDSSVDVSHNGGTSAYSSSALHATIQVALPLPTENADVISGTENADILNGLGGDDHISGHGGNDTITGGKGDDILDGGAGADTFIFNVGDGHDTIVAGGYDNADTIKLIGGTFYDLNYTFEGNDLLVAQVIDQNYNFDDTGYIRLQDFLTGGEHSITVQIDTGINNSFYGTDADLSTVVFHYGTEGLSNASTSEVLIGTSGDDVINGNGGYYDALYGGDGNDTINGGDGVDWIRGGNGDDILYGGKGNDRYDGGAGADTFLFNVGDGIDQIRAGGYDSQDTIKLLGTNFYDINFGRSGQDLWVAQAIDGNYDRNDTGYIELRQFLDGSGGHINVQIDVGHDTNLLYGTDASHATLTFQQGLEGSDNTDHAEIILGTNGDDVINGNGGYYDGLYGNGGNDIINGGYGVDHLIGGTGDDVLHGFGGNDLLRGESGNDTLDGGDGIDTADYRYAADGIVADLSTGHASNDGDGGQDSFISIENVTGSDHNDTITGDAGSNQLDGRAGDDVLMGGGGADILIGGAGADKFVYQSASESTLSHLDVISDFNHGEGDSIDLSALGLAGGIVNGGTIGAFGSAPQVDFGGNGLIIETDGANTRIYADSDHSGSFNAATDLVLQLTGNHLNEIVTQPTSIVT